MRAEPGDFMTTTATDPITSCSQCGLPLTGDELVCPRCHALVHRARIEELVREAGRLEQVNPLLAAGTWRQSLVFLPPDSPQYRWIAARAEALSNGMPPPVGPDAMNGDGQDARPGVMGYRAAPKPPGETWQSVLFKTGGSMLLSILLFAHMTGGWPFAIGFVLLIFLHEMGHVIANWHYGVRQSAPIFLGIFGAVIFLKGNLRNAWEEAVVGIAGPVIGTLGALSCYFWYLQTGNVVAGELAFYAFFINLWNLIPITPLDGGRASAAITPFLWGVGLIGLVTVAVAQLLHSFSRGGPSFWSLLILFYILRSAWPRVRYTLLDGGWKDPYFKIGWAGRLTMTSVYVGVATLLLTCMSSLFSHGFRLW
jgi:Zn-dependent protease